MINNTEWQPYFPDHFSFMIFGLEKEFKKMIGEHYA